MLDSTCILRGLAAVILLLAIASSDAQAEDGYRLWLRYDPVEEPLRQHYGTLAAEIVTDGQTSNPAIVELERGLSGLLGKAVPRRPVIDRDGAILVALSTSPRVRDLHVVTGSLGNEGFAILSTRSSGRRITLITGNSRRALLYGSFELLRRVQTAQPLDHLDVRDRPVLPLRMLDHWDNLDRSVERGYAGKSLWDWPSLPGSIDPRYVDYARATSSLGLNGVVLNNVNADPKILTREYLQKVTALANLFRPYGIRIYLSVRFSSPIETGGLRSADPRLAQVRSWWRAKADEVYRLIPDFGGFLVKANSEGQPGPQDYGATHADGANVIAEALRPHGGTVIWRAFVYGSAGEDRARQAYAQFRPLDGKFASNVIVQVKNGPIDFQPREPFHPLFGQMPKTRIAFEGQITREYLGQNTGVVYLGPMWTETLNADTCAPSCGSPVSSSIAAVAGVSNVGTERNWTGTIFDQANWYALGRLAWNPRLDARSIAEEWTRMTWSNAPETVRPIVSIMMGSRETAVNFMTPLGLAHQMATDHHYGPAPWVCDLQQASWNPCYYNRADGQGIGFDRTVNGSGAVSQYMPPVARRFGELSNVPDHFLLWFHHVPWNYSMRSRRTLWEELVSHYDQGVAEAGAMDQAWMSIRGSVDAERWQMVESDLQRQQEEARWWRDASIAYFQNLSKLPLPKGSPPPAHPLAYYQLLRPPGLPGQRP